MAIAAIPSRAAYGATVFSGPALLLWLVHFALAKKDVTRQLPKVAMIPFEFSCQGTEPSSPDDY
jgi:hypothetical protein